MKPEILASLIGTLVTAIATIIVAWIQAQSKNSEHSSTILVPEGYKAHRPKPSKNWFFVLPIALLGGFVSYFSYSWFHNIPLPQSIPTSIEVIPMAPSITTPLPKSFPVTPSATYFAIQQPEEFIRNYYDLINRREYDKTWNMLTAGFQSRNAPDGLDGYKAFWDSIASVEIQSVEVKERQGVNVVVLVTIKYTAKYGTESTNTHQFVLTPDSKGESWLFSE